MNLPAALSALRARGPFPAEDFDAFARRLAAGADPDDVADLLDLADTLLIGMSLDGGPEARIADDALGACALEEWAAKLRVEGERLKEALSHERRAA